MVEKITAAAKYFVMLDIFLDSPCEYFMLSILECENQCTSNAIPTSNQFAINNSVEFQSCSLEMPR